MPRNPYNQEEQRWDNEATYSGGGFTGYDYNANPGDEPLFEGFGEEGVTDWQAIVEPWLPDDTNIGQWSAEYGMYITPYSDTGEIIAQNQFGVQQEVLRNEAYTEMDSINNAAGMSGFVGSGAIDQDVDTLKNMTVLSNTSQNLQLKSNITDMRKSWQSDLYSMLGTLDGMDAFDEEQDYENPCPEGQHEETPGGECIGDTYGEGPLPTCLTNNDCHGTQTCNASGRCVDPQNPPSGGDCEWVLSGNTWVEDCSGGNPPVTEDCSEYDIQWGLNGC